MSMIEKKFANKNLEIELTSYIDDKQNVRFRGKDIATILGYNDTDQAVRKNVSKNHKMINLVYPQMLPRRLDGPGQKKVGAVKHRVNKMILEGNITHSLTRPASMNLCLVPN